MNERRAQFRVPVGIEGTFHLLGDLSGPQLGITQDVSLGGLRLSSAQRFQPGDKVSIALMLPQQGPVSVTGVVVWSREGQQSGQQNFEAGLRWAEIDAHAQARLNAFVTDYSRTRSFSISSSGLMAPPPLRWHLSVGIAVALFTVGVFLTARWIERRRLVSEVQALRQAVEMYQGLLRSLPR